MYKKKMTENDDDDEDKGKVQKKSARNITRKMDVFIYGSRERQKVQ